MMDAHCFWTEPSFEDGGSLSRRHLRGARKHAIALGVLALGCHICFGGKGGGSAPTPDPNIGIAALKNAELGEEWKDFAEKQFKVGNLRQEQMDALTKQVTEQQLATQNQASQWAAEDRQRYKDEYQPIEDDYLNTVKSYDSPEKQAEAAAEAQADVQKASATQGQILNRNMAAMGINPASGRFAGVTRASATDTALASAGAANTARQAVRDKGLALKADATNLGRGLPSQAASAAGLGLNAGNSAVGNQSAANSNFYQNTGIMGQGYGAAMQGYSNQAGILNNLYGNQVSGYNAQQQANASSSAGIGSAVGTVAGAALMVF